MIPLPTSLELIINYLKYRNESCRLSLEEYFFLVHFSQKYAFVREISQKWPGCFGYYRHERVKYSVLISYSKYIKVWYSPVVLVSVPRPERSWSS